MRVIVNSIGGALVNVMGTVVSGPEVTEYKAMTRKDRPKRRGQMPFFKKQETFQTQPTYRVLLDGYNLEIGFVESELTFTEDN